MLKKFKFRLRRHPKINDCDQIKTQLRNQSKTSTLHMVTHQNLILNQTNNRSQVPATPLSSRRFLNNPQKFLLLIFKRTVELPKIEAEGGGERSQHRSRETTTTHVRELYSLRELRDKLGQRKLKNWSKKEMPHVQREKWGGSFNGNAIFQKNTFLKNNLKNRSPLI